MVDALAQFLPGIGDELLHWICDMFFPVMSKSYLNTCLRCFPQDKIFRLLHLSGRDPGGYFAYKRHPDIRGNEQMHQSRIGCFHNNVRGDAIPFKKLYRVFAQISVFSDNKRLVCDIAEMNLRVPGTRSGFAHG